MKLNETDLKTYGYTRYDLGVEVKGSVKLKSSIEVKKGIAVKEKTEAKIKRWSEASVETKAEHSGEIKH